jgi:hypothetical protein
MHFLRLLFPFWRVYAPAYSARRQSGPNVPGGPGPTTILTLTNVPPGDYLVIAKTMIIPATPTNVRVELWYQDGPSSEIDQTEVGATNPHNLQALIRVSGTAKIWLQAESTQTWTAAHSKIAAVRVETAADAEVTS